MKITETPFKGLLVIEPDIYEDTRGLFFESYNKKAFQKAGINIEFVQDNQSYSVRNVIRGLHFQSPPYAQSKLMRTLSGKVLDVVVDLRKDQPTFKKVFSMELSAKNNVQLLIPKGFAHGFSVLSEAAEILYKCDEFYNPAFASGIHYSDPVLKIDWKVRSNEAIISEKDKALPLMSETVFAF